MNIHELLLSVHEQTFDKNKLEMFHQSLVELHSKYGLRLAELKKERSLFIGRAKKAAKDAGEKRTSISIKEDWEITPLGQEMFDVYAGVDVIKGEMSSLKSRLYNSAY